jgi:lysophospholipase L1-like esterase
MSDLAARPGPVRQVAGVLWAMKHLRRSRMLRPIDGTVVRCGAADADVRRVLLIANGLAHGWGVRSHRVGPTGRLAEGVAAATGTACEVEFVGDAAMSIETASLWLEGRADASFDAAVIALGSNDAQRLLPPAVWAARLEELLAAVRRALPADAPVVVLGVPEVHVTDRLRRVAGVFRRRGRRLDAVTRRVVAAVPNTRFAPAPDLRSLVGHAPGEGLAAAFAAPVAETVATAMTLDAVATAAPRDDAVQDETIRAVVEAARADALQSLQDIVRRARARFGVMESAVTLVDGDRNWHVVQSGTTPMQVPAGLTCCPIVIETDAPLVVPNTRRDPRTVGNAFLELEGARFYAGAPVHAADGTPIGALCLLHALPRSAKRVDLDDLRAFALEAETVVHRLAAARADVEATAG